MREPMPSQRDPMDQVRALLDAMLAKPSTGRVAGVARGSYVDRKPRPVATSLAKPPVRPAAIDVRGLTKRFGQRTAVDGLSFQVPRGSITGFVGPNGSGKTTTIRMLLHLARPDSGQASVLGHGLDEPRAYLPKLGALIEGPAFDPGLSAARNLRVHALLGRHPTSRIPALLELVDLADAGTKPYHAFSLGMKQRLGIAAALLGDPELLILDEPTNGLDPAGIRDMRGLFMRMRDAGKTLFVSSHLISEVERICDHLVVIHDGRLTYQGSVAALGDGRGTLEDRLLDLIEGGT
jgi:ABC-2 type transport system ATP-binding protein